MRDSDWVLKCECGNTFDDSGLSYDAYLREKEMDKIMRHDEWTIGYKLVKDEKGKYFSVFQRGRSGRVRYSLHRKTFPKYGCGPLCVFKSLDVAMEFYVKLNLGYNYKIFECEYRQTREELVWYMSGERKQWSTIKSLPEGTVGADWVKLTIEMLVVV
jgi:hypothetical protein